MVAHIENFVSTSLNAGLQKWQLALSKLNTVVDKYKFTNYREIVYFMRDLKSKNVYNFSRSRLYEQIAKSRRFLQLKNEDKYFDYEDKHMAQNQLI